MPKDTAIVDVALRINLKDSGLDELKRELSNATKNVSLPDNLKRQISEMISQVDELQKAFTNLSKTQVSKAEFGNLKTNILNQITSLDQRTSALETTLSSLVGTLSSADNSAFSNMLKNLRENMDQTAVATRGLIETIDSVSSATSGKNIVKIIDDDSLKGDLRELTGIKSKIERAIDFDFEPIQIKFKTSDDAQKMYDDLVDKYMDASDKLSEMKPNTAGYREALKDVSELSQKIQEVAAAISDQFIGSKFANGISSNFDNITTELKKYLSQVESEIAATKRELGTLDAQPKYTPQKADGGGYTIPIDIRTKSSTLAKKAIQIIEAAQSGIDGHPIHVELQIVSPGQTKKANAALAKFQEQVNNMSDSESRAQMQNIVNEIQKGFGSEISVKLKSSIADAAKEIRSIISEVRKELNDNKIVINPHVEFTSEEIASMKNQVEDVAKTLSKTLSDSAKGGFVEKETKNKKGSKQTEFGKLEKQIGGLITNISSIPSQFEKSLNQVPDAFQKIGESTVALYDQFVKLDSLDMGRTQMRGLADEINNVKKPLLELLALFGSGNNSKASLTDMLSGWRSSDLDMISVGGINNLRERSAVIGTDGVIYGKYAYGGKESTNVKYSTIARMKSNGISPEIGIHSHPATKIAASSSVVSDNSGDIISFYSQLKQGLKKQLTAAFDEIELFDTEGFYNAHKNIDFNNKSVIASIKNETQTKIKEIQKNQTLYLKDFINQYSSKSFDGSAFEGGLKEYLFKTLKPLDVNENDITNIIKEVTNNFGTPNLSLEKIFKNAFLSTFESSDFVDNYFSNIYSGKDLFKSFGIDGYSRNDFNQYQFRRITPDIYRDALKITDYEDFVKIYKTDDFINQNPLHLSDESLNGLFDNSGIKDFANSLSGITVSLETFANSMKQLSDIPDNMLNFGSEDISKIAINIDSITQSLIELLTVYKEINGIASSDLVKNFTEIQDAAKAMDGIKLNTKLGKDSANSILEMYKNYRINGGQSLISDIGGPKNLQKYLIKHYDEGVNKSVDAVSEESEAMREVDSSAKDASSAKQDFATANQELLQSIINSVSGIENEGKAFTNLNKLINNLGNSKNTEKLEATKKNLEDIIKILNTNVGAESFIKSLENLASTGDSLKDLTTVLNATKEQVKIAQQANDKKKQSTYNSYLDQQKNKYDNLYLNANKARSNAGNDYTPKYREELEKVAALWSEINDLKNKHTDGNWDTDDIDKVEEKLKEIDRIYKGLNDKNNISARTSDVDTLIAKATKKLNDNSMSRDLAGRYQAIIAQLQEVRVEGGDAAEGIAAIDQVSLNAIKGQLRGLDAELERTGQTGKGFWKQFSSAITSKSANFLAQYFSLQDLIRYGREITQTVTTIDSANTELKKVSGETNDRIQQSFTKSAETAQELGATISEVINSTADWSRLGYDIDQAEELARVTTLYQTVGDNMTQESASESLVSMLQGFHIDPKNAERVIDSVNEVANNFAIDTLGRFMPSRIVICDVIDSYIG